MPPATAALADWGMTLKGRIFAYCKYIQYAEVYNGFQYYISMPIYIYYIIYTHVLATKHLWVANQFVSRFFRSRYAYFSGVPQRDALAECMYIHDTFIIIIKIIIICTQYTHNVIIHIHGAPSEQF